MKVFSAVLCAILLAGANATPIAVSHEAGSQYAFSVIAIGKTIASCRLITPLGVTLEFVPGHAAQHGDKYELQPISATLPSCAVLVMDLQNNDNGLWEISSVNTDDTRNLQSYQLTVTGTVNAGDTSSPDTTEPVSTSTLVITRDRSVEQDVGPANAVYCRLEDPQGLAVYDSFGRCHLSLDKVGLEHHGTWKMLVATAGRVLTDEHQLIVNVRESEGKAAVTTHVAKERPIATVTCSVQTKAAVTGCKFRNPHGKILIAASGVSEGRYDFYGRGVSNVNGVSSYECGIRMTDPITADLGMWRCAIETAEETYFGHVPVLCPWALDQPAIAAVVQQEPILRPTRSLVSAVEGDSATMSCSVEAVIRYCYFRFSNGTIFTITPGMSSSSMEYVGAGFDAGECGVRFHEMSARDSGRWSCHVGLEGVADEQSDQFQVTVHERMQVRHFHSEHSNIMTVEGIVYEGRALEYCRFVRIDGFGFTTDNMPSQYTMTGILANGECQFTIRTPNILEMHPWTIVARIRGQDVEITKDTMESVIIGTPAPAPEGETTPAPAPGQVPEDNLAPIIIYQNTGLAIFMYVFLSLLLVSIVLGGLLCPKRNREWTAQRASAVRRRLSNSFRRKPPQGPAPTYTP